VAKGFRARDGRVVGRLDRDEVTVLRGMLADVQTLVRADGDDPVSRRLFPDASPDPAVAADLRELLHDDLREAKLANARAMAESLPDDGRVDLAPDEADQWAAAINDIRLAYGTALGVTEDMDEAAYEDDPAMHLYWWLTYLQELLVDALSAGGVDR
jgi:transposase InsO family protein